MEKKKWVSLVIAFTLFFSFVSPIMITKAETELQKIDRQLKAIQQQKQEAASKFKNINSQISNVKYQQQTAQRTLASLNTQIDQKEKELFQLEGKIEVVAQQAKDAAVQLEEATIRVEERNELLKTRLRLMYRKGDVQYLEVLLGSNGFSDFIQRFDALQKILESDKKILEDNIRDKNIIVEKKKEIDQSLAQLEGLFAEAEKLKATLVANKEKQKVTIASLQEKEQELLEFKEEEERMLMDLAAKESKLMQAKYSLKFSGGKFAWPVPASTRITSDYGYRLDPFTGRASGHNGLDIGRAPGTSTLMGADIVAAADGVVIVASYVNGFGNTVMIDHGSGIWTIYGHIRNGGIFVNKYQEVKKGQKIAEVGSTGRSTGPHLHFQVNKDGKPISPWDYLSR